MTKYLPFLIRDLAKKEESIKELLDKEIKVVERAAARDEQVANKLYKNRLAKQCHK